MKRREKTIRSLLCVILAGVLALLSACGGANATTMRLRKAQGEVQVTDGEQKNIALAEELGLYSGYSVDTQAESYAWIDLDSVKLTKMDAESRVEIRKEGKNLEISVISGSLFFNVTEPLAEDETMSIRTADLLVGIRGTCGWVDAQGKRAALLEGEVRCEAASGAAATISAGEKAELDASGQLIVSPLTGEDIPAFVLAELTSMEDQSEEHMENAGPEAGPVVTLTLPVTVEELRSCLSMEQVQTVIVLPSDDEDTLVIGETPLWIMEGKSLVLEEGVLLQADGEPPVTTENGESRSITVYNEGTLEVRSDILCNGDISNKGTMKVGGSFVVTGSGEFWNGASGDYESDTPPQIVAAQGIQCYGKLWDNGNMEGGLTLIGGRAELTGTVDKVTADVDSKVFFYGVDIGYLELADRGFYTDDPAYLTVGTLVLGE